MITKTVQPSKDVFIQFTEDELLELGIKPGDKFTVTQHEDGSVEFKKKVPLEIDLDEFGIDVLKNLVKESIETDKPVGDIIEDALQQYVDSVSINSDESYEF